MNTTFTTPRCPACGAQVSPELRACPGCHRLVHAARLGELAQQASAAEQAGEITAALERWREALDLLPEETTQAATIRDRIAQLGQQLGTAKATPGIPAGKGGKGGSAIGKATGILGVIAMLAWKLKAVLIFALTKGKLLLLGLTKGSTFLSMFTFFAAYWSLFGWPLALGLVVSIYIHEMGHVDALRRFGFKATAPMFLPGIGAIVRLRQNPTNAMEDARIGLAGPLWGMGAAVACYVIYLSTHASIWAALAHLGALINIFNLLPIASLDGSRGMRALSRGQAWLITGALAAAWIATSEGMILLVAIVAMIRAIAKPKDAPADRTACLLFVLLIAGLSALACVRMAVPAR